MEFKTKYSLGDLVYMIVPISNHKSVFCSSCNGDKYLQLEKNFYKCPRCEGTGKIFQGEYIIKWEFFEKPRKIDRIRITETIKKDKSKKIEEIYGFVSSSYSESEREKNFWYIPATNLFSSLKEAKLEVKKRNANLDRRNKRTNI
jgi:hypothetical protein